MCGIFPGNTVHTTPRQKQMGLLRKKGHHEIIRTSCLEQWSNITLFLRMVATASKVLPNTFLGNAFARGKSGKETSRSQTLKRNRRTCLNICAKKTRFKVLDATKFGNVHIPNDMLTISLLFVQHHLLCLTCCAQSSGLMSPQQ